MPPLKRTAAYAVEWRPFLAAPWYLYRVSFGRHLHATVEEMQSRWPANHWTVLDWRVRRVPTGAGRGTR